MIYEKDKMGIRIKDDNEENYKIGDYQWNQVFVQNLTKISCFIQS